MGREEELKCEPKKVFTNTTPAAAQSPPLPSLQPPQPSASRKTGSGKGLRSGEAPEEISGLGS